MIDEHDEKTNYCRRLGHAVPFRYCRGEHNGQPCRLILDCWWEQFDIQAYFLQHYSPDFYDSLRIPSPPPNKVLTLLDLIQRAQARLEQENANPPDAAEEDNLPLDPV